MTARHILTGLPPGQHAAAAIRDLRARRASNTVKNPDFRILEVIAGLCTSFRKTYSTAGQEKICELLRRYYGRVMSRRTLNRHLNALCQGQYMRRVRRHRRDKKLGFVFRSTLCVPQWRYCHRLARNAQAIFSLIRSQSGPGESSRVTKMAQHLSRFYQSVLGSPEKAGSG
jgi:hypothetical protein